MFVSFKLSPFLLIIIFLLFFGLFVSTQRAQLPLYYRKSVGALVFFDISNSRSFDIIEQWINDILVHSPHPVIAIVGNKCDLESTREVNPSQAQELVDKIKKSQKLNIFYMETSALSGKNVNELFEELSRHILEDAGFNVSSL